MRIFSGHLLVTSRLLGLGAVGPGAQVFEVVDQRLQRFTGGLGFRLRLCVSLVIDS
jgi:hypothetical protein